MKVPCFAQMKIMHNTALNTNEDFLSNIYRTLQMFAGIYRDFAGKFECRDFKFTGIACIPVIPVIFEVNQKKCGLFISILFIKIFQISL